MKNRLSPRLVRRVKLMLPDLRKEVKKDFKEWTEYLPVQDFSDEKVMELLPFAAQEYFLIYRDVRADRRTIVEWLNEGVFDTALHKVVAHTLRKGTV